MPKKRPKPRKDENEVAFDIVQGMIGEGPRAVPPGEGEKNPEAVARGSKGSKKGGRARSDKLSAAPTSYLQRNGPNRQESRRGSVARRAADLTRA